MTKQDQLITSYKRLAKWIADHSSTEDAHAINLLSEATNMVHNYEREANQPSGLWVSPATAINAAIAAAQEQYKAHAQALAEALRDVLPYAEGYKSSAGAIERSEQALAAWKEAQS